jgi:hypothetical protein
MSAIGVHALVPPGGVAGSGVKGDATETGGDLAYRNAGLHPMSGPAPAPPRVRVGEASGDSNGERATADGPVHHPGRERDRVLVSAAAETHKQRVVALVGQRPAVRDAQRVGVIGVGQRLGPPGLVPRRAHVGDRVLAIDLASEGLDHGDLHTRAVAGAAGLPPLPPPPPVRGQVTAVRGDHVGVDSGQPPASG